MPLRRRLNALVEGMVDLMEPFKRRDIYHWRMNGSYSLKSVLPVLVPEMTNEGLEISDGMVNGFHERFGPLLGGDDVANAIHYVVTRPPHVHISDIIVRPTRQDYP